MAGYGQEIKGEWVSTRAWRRATFQKVEGLVLMVGKSASDGSRRESGRVGEWANGSPGKSDGGSKRFWVSVALSLKWELAHDFQKNLNFKFHFIDIDCKQ